VRRIVKDSPLPHPIFDKNTLEMSLDWRELFTAFFVEERAFSKMNADAFEQTHIWLEELKARVDRGEADVVELWSKASKALAENKHRSARLARRARIRRQYKEFQDYDWDIEVDWSKAQETKIIEQLICIENMSCWAQDFSDDEFEEESEEDVEGNDNDDTDGTSSGHDGSDEDEEHV
jgi:hypothetical protein